MNTEDEFVTPSEPNSDSPLDPPGEVAAEESARPAPPPPRPPRPKQPRTLPIFIVVLGVFAAVGLGIYFFGPDAKLRPFRPHLAEYGNTAGLKVASSAPVGLFGKVIILDGDASEIDPATFRLPEDLRPKRHEDVGTVIIHRKQPLKEIGHYDEGQYAFVQVWRLILIDRASGTLYPWLDVEGPKPREKVQSKEGNQIGGPPTDEMLEAISKLKRLSR